MKKPVQRAGRRNSRRGAVAVEFAIVAPVLIGITVGMIQLTRAYDAQTLLESAAREGARFAAMDREGFLPEGQSTNDKLTTDVESFLAANGIDPDDVTVEIKDYENPDADFDLDDPENALELFEVRVSVEYSSVSTLPVAADNDYTMTGAVVFRNGIATISN